jgi:SAM-dependent methyltransferase
MLIMPAKAGRINPPAFTGSEKGSVSLEKRRLYTILLSVFSLIGPSYSAANPKAGPYLLCTQRDQAVAYWYTESPAPSVLEYGSSPNLGSCLRDNTPKQAHRLVIPVQAGATYYYRIHGQEETSKTFQFEATFGYGGDPMPDARNPYAQDQWSSVYAQAAEYILAQYGQSQGICVDYGCGKGRLAWEIARRSRLRVIGFNDDPEQVMQARRILDEAGIYGTQVVIHEANLDQLACRDYLANLIISDQTVKTGIAPGTASEMFRILRPDGGMAVLGTPCLDTNLYASASLSKCLGEFKHSTDHANGHWARIDRAPLPGAGTWNHFYANPAHTAASTETGLTDSMQLLWYGQPGPRNITDRHNRPMSSLYREGIMVTPGIDRLMAYDAYNGTRYWDMIIPESTRVSVLRDSAWLALAPERVYLAHQQNCVALDLRTGIPQQHFSIPDAQARKENSWGYVSLQEDRLYGSSQQASASVIGQNRPRIMAFSYGDKLPIGVSETVFCRDRHTGELRWTYGDGQRVIINPSITLSQGAMVFLESTHPAALNAAQARIPAPVLLPQGHAFLVKLDPVTGTLQWRKPVALPFQHAVYLQISEKQKLIIATGARDLKGKIHYDFHAFLLGSGRHKWTAQFDTDYDIGASHGEQEQHPVIIDTQLYTKYCQVDLHDGNVKPFALNQSSGCGTLSACATHVFARGANPFMYGLPNRMGTRLTSETRPGCWINIFPVGGLVMIPESSSGCSCDFPIQATMAFQPLHRSEASAHAD